MAEAFLSLQPHTAGTSTENGPSTSKLRVSWSSTGIDIHVPAPRYLWRGVHRTVIDNIDKVSAMLYPLPLSCVALCAVSSCAYVWHAPSSSWVHTSPASVWLRYIDSILTPFSRYLPPTAQAPVLCAKVWAVILAGATVLHRFALRRLLQYKGWMLEKNPRKPSWRTRVWAFVVRTFFTRPSIPKTWVYESCLPSLPLPSIQQTVNTYLSSMRAIYHQKDSDVNDWLELRRAAESFLLSEGPTLQKHLRLQHVMASNYVTESWTRHVFLSARDSLSLRSNFYAVPFANYAPTHLPEARAAVLIYLLTQLQSQIESRRLCPHFTGPRNCVPTTMHQYAMAFNTTRIPGREMDVLEHYTERDQQQHIIVLHRGRVYQLPVRDPHSGRQLTPHQLEVVLHQLLAEIEEEVTTGRDESENDDAEDTLEILGRKRSYRVVESLVPVLTTMPRARWADVRNAFLLHDSNNSVPLRAVEKAMFVVSFDDRCGSPLPPPPMQSTRSPADARHLSDDCAHYLCGTGSNLWCDKSFNLVVRADAQVGLHVEHSWCDMSTFLGLFEHVTAQEEMTSTWYEEETGSAKKLREDERRSKPFRAPLLGDPLSPRRLRFTIYKKLADAIREANTAFMMNIASQVDLHVVRYDGYGRELPKSLGCSPDAWVQMALQLAQSTDQQGQLGQIYESVSQHVFARGRTEAVRSVTDGSIAFVKAMQEPATGTGEEVAAVAERRRALLMEACVQHQRAVQAAVAGRGVDRHLFALFMASVSQSTPSDFLTAVLRKTQWVVSSAQMRQRYLDACYHPSASTALSPVCLETPGVGFGPVALDGYGVSYCYCEGDVLYVTVTANKDCDTTSARALGNHLIDALDMLGELSSAFRGSTSPRLRD